MVLKSNVNFWLVFAVIFALIFVVGSIIVVLINKKKGNELKNNNNEENSNFLSGNDKNSGEDVTGLEDQQIFQKVFDCVLDVLPNNWKRVAIYCAVLENMIDLNYFVDTGKGYVRSFNSPDYDRDKFDNLTLTVYGIVKPIREKLPKNKKWNVLTMFVTNDGKFKCNFSYDDISENFIEYADKWEKENIDNK